MTAGGLTSRHLLHENLDESILTDGAQILDNVFVLQVLVEGDFLMEGLRVSAGTNKTSKPFHSTATRCIPNTNLKIKLNQAKTKNHAM